MKTSITDKVTSAEGEIKNSVFVKHSSKLDSVKKQIAYLKTLDQDSPKVKKALAAAQDMLAFVKEKA